MSRYDKITVSFNLNGEDITVQTLLYRRLLDLLREDLHLVGTKEGCGIGECGACTVIVDGKAVTSCMMLAGQVEGKQVLTIEGVGKDGTLDPIQTAVLDQLAIQCGFCTPGFVMSAKALIDENPNATLPEERRAISGNLCRRTGYEQLAKAIYQEAQSAAASVKENDHHE